MNFFKKIFRRRKQFKPQPKQLRIDGTKTVMTPAPDDAELAAAALIEHMCDVRGKREEGRCKMYDVRGKMEAISHQTSAISHQTSNTHDAAYYRQLSEKIRTAHEQERRAAMRYVAYVEEQLSTPLAHREGQGESPFAELERGLYKFQDVIEREMGGALGEHSETLATKGTQELLRRWQKCLAECIVKQYSTKTNTDLTDDADEPKATDDHKNTLSSNPDLSNKKRA